ncbi:tripartite motif-containing protein 55-like, partial [Ruditapes philippinarum]|uniref:tripartite motif-containing protein 55-like n=1 Tax=Ruditapes philippinarum TaxID=129788 RepID=UPI00295BA10B
MFSIYRDSREVKMGKKLRKKTTVTVQEKKDIFSALCDKHPKYTVDLFCVDCNKVICVICQATEHNNGDHKKIQTIEDAATNCAETKEFVVYEKNMSVISTRVNETLANNYKITTTTEHLKEEAASLIRKHKEDLIGLIERHHKILYERNRFKYENSIARLRKVNEQLTTKERETSDIHQEINEKKESGQDVALFIAMKKSQDNLQQIEIELEEIEKLNFVERQEFQPGHMVEELLKEEKEFGVLLVTALASPKEDVTQKLVVPSRDTMTSYHTGVRVLPSQSDSMGQDELTDEDESDGYEPVGQIAETGTIIYQKNRQEYSLRRDSTLSLNTLFTEEPTEQERLCGGILKDPNT